MGYNFKDSVVKIKNFVDQAYSINTMLKENIAGCVELFSEDVI